MEKILVIFAFFVIKWLLSSNKEKKKRNKTPHPNQQPSSPKKSIEDIFGDFMDEVNKKNTPKPVFTKSSDTHKAEEDTNKNLDWQEVTRSKFAEKEVRLANDNYRKPKTKIPEVIIEPLEIIEESNDDILENIDLRKAVIYKEILDRKYFSI